MADTLFLLKPDFADAKAGPHHYYCPSCAAVRGVLAYYPALFEQLNVVEVDFPRPRPQVAEWLGTEHPGCPVLVLDRPAPAGFDVKTAPTGRLYLADLAEIQRYLAVVHGSGMPH
jgi:hypothetical protein